MSSRVLTPDVVGIDALVHDHQTVLAKAEGGVVAVFDNNAPAFYAVTPARLAELLALEEKLADRPFARCNSGYLVNLAQVQAVQQNTVEVGPYELQVSRPKRKSFLAALTDYIGGDGL